MDIQILLFTILNLIGFLLLFSSKWALEYFGLSCFEQIIYHLKVPLEGTNTEFISDWFKLCLSKSVLLSVICYLPSLFSLTYASNYIIIALVVFTSCLIYAAYLSGLLSFILNQFRKSELFENHYVDANDVKITFPKQKKNLIYLYVESLENTYSSKENGGNYTKDLIPELSKYALENTYFSSHQKLNGARMVSGTGWTTAGIVAQSAGIPLFSPLMSKPYKEDSPFLPGVKALGDILAQQGYNQEYLIGSDALFGGRKFFFEKHGNYHLFDLKYAYQEGKIAPDYKQFWGFEDQKLFTFAKEELTRLSTLDKPFNLTLLTVDTHHPKGYSCPLCKEEYPQRLSNIIRCNSAQIGEFIEWVKQQPFYENTAIIISGDHLSMAANYIHKTYDKKYQRTLFNAFINVDVKKERQTQSFTSFDMFPTTIAALNASIEGNRLGLGVNLFSKEKTLLELIGEETLNKELKKQSHFYQNHILK